MALLINCPECGMQIVNNGEDCPFCGYSIKLGKTKEQLDAETLQEEEAAAKAAEEEERKAAEEEAARKAAEEEAARKAAEEEAARKAAEEEAARKAAEEEKLRAINEASVVETPAQGSNIFSQFRQKSAPANQNVSGSIKETDNLPEIPDNSGEKELPPMTPKTVITVEKIRNTPTVELTPIKSEKLGEKLPPMTPEREVSLEEIKNSAAVRLSPIEQETVEDALPKPNISDADINVQNVIRQPKSTSEITVEKPEPRNTKPPRRTVSPIKQVANQEIEVEKPVHHPVQQPIQPPVQPPVQQPIQQPIQPPVQPPVHQPIQPPVQPIQQPVQPPVQPPIQQPIQPSVQQPVQQPIQPPVQQPIQQPVQPSVQQPMQSQRPPVQQPMSHSAQGQRPPQQRPPQQRRPQQQRQWSSSPSASPDKIELQPIVQERSNVSPTGERLEDLPPQQTSSNPNFNTDRYVDDLKRRMKEDKSLSQMQEEQLKSSSNNDDVVVAPMKFDGNEIRGATSDRVSVPSKSRQILVPAIIVGVLVVALIVVSVIMFSQGDGSGEQTSGGSVTSGSSTSSMSSGTAASSGKPITFTKPDKWDDAYVYIYNDEDKSICNADFPGEKMTKNSDGTYSYTLTKDIENPVIIFDDGTKKKQYPMSGNLKYVAGKSYDTTTKDS